MTKQLQEKRVHLVLYSFRGLESMTIKVGSMQAGMVLEQKLTAYISMSKHEA